MMIIAGAALQPRASHYLATGSDGANAANVVLAEAATAGPALQTVASSAQANSLNVPPRPTFSEPFLLLLMGTLLISVGTGFRRWTTRRTPRPAVPRRT
ncbi:MAG TPA: hypothetical protein VJZ91_04425 [Blastocatellia bacterium]|nr:hypothetical protein [Blastocatellia bacterium]